MPNSKPIEYVSQGLAAPFDGGMGSPIPKGPPVGSSEEVFLTAYGSWAGWRRSDFKTTLNLVESLLEHTLPFRPDLLQSLLKVGFLLLGHPLL